MASGQESDLVAVNRDVFMGSISNCHGDSYRCGEVPPMDVDQSLPPDNVEQHGDGLVADIDIDEDNIPLPPLLGGCMTQWQLLLPLSQHYRYSCWGYPG